jgi:hypothetical protein
MNQLTTIDSRAGIPQASEFMPGFDASSIAGPSFTEALVDPRSTFGDPSEVMDDPRFSREEKRTILLSWARDEFLLEQMAHKTPPELGAGSQIDAVIEALSQFDQQAAAEYRAAVDSIRARRLRDVPDAHGRGRFVKAKSSWRSATCTSAASV